MKRITNELIQKFKTYLINDEKSSATLEKYIRDVTTFMQWLCDREVEKVIVMEYKQSLIENYAPASANSMLSSINSFFGYMEWYPSRESCRYPPSILIAPLSLLLESVIHI